MAAHELGLHGLSVTKDASKSLTMSIMSVKIERGWFMDSYRVEMNVKTSDGYVATYTGEKKFPSDVPTRPYGHLDTAFMRVVVEMLNDSKITAFLGSQKIRAHPQKQDVSPKDADDVVFAKLTKLKELLDKGIITPSEFDARKKRILSE